MNGRGGGRHGGHGGGRGGGRGHIAMTQAELTDLINTRVAEALAAYQAGTMCTKHSLSLCRMLESYPFVLCSFINRSTCATESAPSACLHV